MLQMILVFPVSQYKLPIYQLKVTAKLNLFLLLFFSLFGSEEIKGIELPVLSLSSSNCRIVIRDEKLIFNTINEHEF